MFSYNHEKRYIIQRSELHVSLLWYTMRFLIEILFRVRDLNKYPDTLIYWTKKSKQIHTYAYLSFVSTQLKKTADYIACVSHIIVYIDMSIRFICFV